MKLPNFSFEKQLSRKGYQFIAGVDEVGKGCFAGPLVTGCVIFPLGIKIPESVVINDSKKMRPKGREKSEKWIKENSLAWGIGEVSAEKINIIGMGKAAKIAFRKSISEARKRLGKPIDYLIADAFFISHVPGLPARRRKNKKGRYYKKVSGRQQAIINGDEKSFSIAAASIIAKVYRDNLMVKLSHRPRYKYYGWGRNKGYGTKEHQNAIEEYGTTRQHRKMWVDTWLSKLKTQ